MYPKDAITKPNYYLTFAQSGDRSIIDVLRPSFEQLDLLPPSIDLVEWTLSTLSAKNASRTVDGLKIPTLLMELSVMRSANINGAADTLVQLITQLDASEASKENARYLILNLVSAAESKWPGVFQ